MDEYWSGFYILNRLAPFPTGALLKAPADRAGSVMLRKVGNYYRCQFDRIKRSASPKKSSVGVLERGSFVQRAGSSTAVVRYSSLFPISWGKAVSALGAGQMIGRRLVRSHGKTVTLSCVRNRSLLSVYSSRGSWICCCPS